MHHKVIALNSVKPNIIL